MDVKKSAIGSVTFMFLALLLLPILLLLPTRLHHSWDFPLQGQQAEAQAAHLKLAQIPARPAAALAAVAVLHLELRLPVVLGDLCVRCHLLVSPSLLATYGTACPSASAANGLHYPFG